MDWIEKIKEALELRKNKRIEIDTELNKLISELKNKIQPIRVDLTAASDDSLNWQLLIGVSKFTIDEKEIDKARIRYDDNHNPTDEKGDLVESLKELIVSKFEHSIK
jgi:hypothetical protein